MDTPGDASGPPPLLWQAAGAIPYDVASAWQVELVRARTAGEICDVVVTLEHPPVYTAGRHADVAAHVLSAQMRGARPDIPLVPTDRGGDVTYHGPGQLVAYPIVKLNDPKGVRAYVRALEAAIVRTLGTYGLQSRHGEDESRSGVWVGNDKIAAIGVRVSGGITSHGLALNVAPALEDFAGIIPCGIADAGVCSMKSLGVKANQAEVEAVLVGSLAVELDREVRRALTHEVPTLSALALTQLHANQSLETAATRNSP